jgi:outer membrane protein assembly factor BamB
MELTNRVVRILYLNDLGLLVSDTVGRVHLLDDDLNLLRSSTALTMGRPLYGLAASGNWAVTRDLTGQISRWDLRTLELVDYLDPAAACDRSSLLEGEAPTLVINRGLAIWGGRVYANNGFMQLAVIDLESFVVDKIVPSPTGDVPIEWICTEHPTLHAVSDKEGRLFLGDLKTMEFPMQVRVDSKANLHRVKYDTKHDRFWVTQDSGDGEFADVANGVVIVGTDGTIIDQLRFARDDVEFLEFSDDYTTVYVGGFDGLLYVFDNSTPELKIVRTIEPFSHQLSDYAAGAAGCAYVLTQDGEIVKLDADGAIQCRASFRRQCVWDIQPSLEDQTLLYCATDEGVTTVRTGTDGTGVPSLVPVCEQPTGFGFTRRVVAMPGGWAAITRDWKLLRYSLDDGLLWREDLDSHPHTLAASPDSSRLLVAANSGGIEVAAESGEIISRLEIDGLPLWCAAYLPSGERVLATRNGVIRAFTAAGETSWQLDTGEYPKRMRWEQGALKVCGENGTKSVAADGSAILGRWTEMMSNTCENSAWNGRSVFTVTYACQLLAYDEASGELIGLVEGLPDFPKGLIAIEQPTGERYILVGGRGGYLSLYRVDTKAPNAFTGVLTHVRDMYLRRTGFGKA